MYQQQNDHVCSRGVFPHNPGVRLDGEYYPLNCPYNLSGELFLPGTEVLTDVTLDLDLALLED